MPGTTLPPNIGRKLDAGTARVERFERQTVTPARGARPWLPPYTSPVALSAGDESEPFYVDENLTIVILRISLLNNATADHTIEVRVAGAAIQQFTLSAGSKTVVAACAIFIGAGSYLTMKAITDTDAKLTIQPTAQ